ncbi:transposase [Streptomyces noursei]|uniref:transposase n=1 Tax=Streptomyces noursei TaxID=1971 RepID=UPI0037FE212A
MSGTDTGGFAPGQIRLGEMVSWQKSEYQVVAFQGLAVVLLAPGASVPVEVLHSALVAAPDFAVLDAEGQSVSRPALPDLTVPPTKEQRKQALRWQRHMKELDTGLVPGQSAPRPGYDPSATTLAQRYAVKSQELAAAGIDVKPKTLEAMRLKWKGAGENPLVLLEQRKRRVGHRTDSRVIEVMREVVKAKSRESGVDVQSVYDDVLDVVRERYAPELADPDEQRRLLPSRATFYRRMDETGLADLLAAPTRRRAQQASKPAPPYTPSHALRPGQVVQIDTSPLKVKAVGDNGEVISAELTSAIDVASRSNAAVMIVPVVTGEGSPGKRIGGRATRAFDLVLLLAQCFAPLTTRPGWHPRAAAAASALPFEALRAADDRFTQATAARPVIHPRTVIIDQGSPYLSDHFKYVCEMLNISIEYARKDQPTDKPLKERFFRTLGSRFSQYLPGWTGGSFRRRGLGLERMPLYTINELQEAAEQWVALDYQQQPHKGLRSPLTPGLTLSPNEMYAHLVAGTGHRPRPVTAEEARRMLIPAWVTITDTGITIENLTYQSSDQRMRLLTGQCSGITAHNDRFEARYNPYHPEVAWLFDHLISHEWIEVEFIHRNLLTCRWTQDLWERVTASVVENGGRKDDQAAIALAVREFRRETRKGPTNEQKAVRVPFQGPPQTFESAPPVDPYEGVSIDASAITASPSLPVAGGETDRPPQPDASNGDGLLEPSAGLVDAPPDQAP